MTLPDGVVRPFCVVHSVSWHKHTSMAMSKHSVELEARTALFVEHQTWGSRFTSPLHCAPSLFVSFLNTLVDCRHHLPELEATFDIRMSRLWC